MGFLNTLRTLYDVCQQQLPYQDDLFFTSFTVTILLRCSVS